MHPEKAQILVITHHQTQQVSPEVIDYQTRQNRLSDGPQREVRPFSRTLRLNKHDRMMYIPLQFCDYGNRALLDTGSLQSAISESELRRELTASTQRCCENHSNMNIKIS